MLLDVVEIKGSTLDPCKGTGGIASAWPTSIQTWDIDKHWKPNKVCDALQEKANFDIIVFSPPFELADIFLVWAIENATSMVAMHISGDYFTNAPTYRREYIIPYIKQQLVVFVHGLEIQRRQRRCMWLVIFKNKQAKKDMLKRKNVGLVYTNVRTL